MKLIRFASAVAAVCLITSSAATSALMPVPASAGSQGNGSGYGTQPGYNTAITNSKGCAGHGAFGAFGKDFNFGNSTSGHVPYPGNQQNGNGANGHLTGLNNSSLCGQPQGHP